MNIINQAEKSLSKENNLSDKKVILLLAFILIIGSILRFYGLGSKSLWWDELLTWFTNNVESLRGLIDNVRRYEGNAPLYHLIIYPIMKYIGDSESILRFPSAISGILSIIVIFLLGVRLYSYREGLIASALMAILITPIDYSQQARYYSMLLLFTSLATYFWVYMLQCLDKKDKLPSYITSGYIIIAIATSYLHYFGVYLIILHGLGALSFFIRRRQALFHIFVIYLIIFFAYLPWLPIMLLHIKRGYHGWIPKPELFLSIRKFMRFLFNGSNLLAVIVVIMYMFLFLHRLKDILKKREYKDMRTMFLSPDILLTLWLTVPFIGIYIKSIISAPIFYTRYLIISLPPAYLLLARSLTQLPIRSKAQTILACAMIGLFLFHTIFIKDYYSQSSHNTQQFREAVDYIVKNDHVYKNSIITGNTGNTFFGNIFLMNYYFHRKNSSRMVEIGDSPADVAAVIKEREPRYIWYICGHWNCPNKEYLDFLNENLRLIMHRDFYNTGVWLFERR